MKTTESSKLDLKAFEIDNNKVINGDGGSKTNKTVVNLFKNKKSRNLTRMPNIGTIKKPNFLNPNAKKIFKHLRLAFIKASIL